MSVGIADFPVLAEERQSLRRRARLLRAVPIGTFAGTVALSLGLLLVPWWAAAVLALLIGAALAASLVRPTPLQVEALCAELGATRVAFADSPRLVSLSDSLSGVIGVEPPAVYVIDCPGANVAALAGPGESALIVTTGMLDGVDRVALEGLVAEGLSRIRTGQAELALLVARRWFGSLLGSPASGAERFSPLAALLVRFGKDVLADVASARQFFLDDMTAVSVTRYPPGLSAALEHVERVGSVVPSVPIAAAPLFVCSPFPETVAGPLVDVFAPHPPVVHRVDLLGEL